MQSKNRKINKEELELWKQVTKDDIIIGEYTTRVEANSIQKKKNVIPQVTKYNSKVAEKKSSYFKQAPQINNRMKVKLLRGIIRPEVKLDLHGNTLKEAKKSLLMFVKSCIDKNIRCILVITGKKKTLNGSKGLIRESLPLWLKEHELSNYILFHCYATKRDGDDGARYILLRKKDRVFYD